MSFKTCFKCLLSKSAESFYRHAAMKGGRLNKCIECTKAAVRENRLNKADYYRSYEHGRSNLPHRVGARLKYQRTDAYRVSQAASNKRWQVANAIRRSAQLALGYAVKRGDVSPLPCFVCGEKAQAHHPDYNAPLAVSWLCPPHHKQAHALMKELTP